MGPNHWALNENVVDRLLLFKDVLCTQLVHEVYEAFPFLTIHIFQRQVSRHRVHPPGSCFPPPMLSGCSLCAQELPCHYMNKDTSVAWWYRTVKPKAKIF